MSDTVLGSHSFELEEVYRVKWSSSSPDLVAAGTSHSLQILRLDQNYVPSLVTQFRLGSRVTHISWGPTVLSEDGKNVTLRIELLVACADQKIRVLTYHAATDSQPKRSSIKKFGQSNSGHSGRITSLAWCSVPGYAHVIGSAATDKCVLIWNLESSLEETESDEDANPPTPTLIGPFKSTPVTISFHPTSSSRLMVYDADGTIKLIDWTKPTRPIIICLIEPRTLVNSMSLADGRLGMADWKVDEADVFGALNGNRWAVWDMRSTRAGTPLAAGDVWGPGIIADVFRWSPTNPRMFAVSTSSPNAASSGAGAIQVYYLSFLQSPRIVHLPGQPSEARSRVHDLDWQPMCPDADVLCIATGRRVVWIKLGMREL
ncbi:hypothetical protein PCANC_01991 [Puccinia coronata f. sp. avenae]|uniref:Uncharacterized protein n=1 Tax=Puccinia coronata f. sp. avenae TaxID=200324 RepID=A0A2N5W1N5_9BASI|nr:hypothetical protein PCASD_19496 [Puccinia coronata f. sp. avenae]PLW19748.1 hypothetical protein PCANC_07645 [Puccinia coronata f. sp. avenae]PLW41006.1 hypothetical protein PCASD_06602 [Puccinia coronata f. sp. avenae]PLW56173.1 hypothetical protein PCANC_01991 [Puccinia coronata f. sp. avenae]